VKYVGRQSGGEHSWAIKEEAQPMIWLGFSRGVARGAHSCHYSVLRPFVGTVIIVRQIDIAARGVTRRFHSATDNSVQLINPAEPISRRFSLDWR
jgi:hypothetical protein